MCLQCITKAESYGEIVPDFHLMRSTQEYDEWQLGVFGLVECNDPTYYLDGLPNPVCDPMFGLTEEEAEELRKNPDIDAQEDMFIEQMHIMMDNLLGRPMEGYRLYKACLDSGYNFDEHGQLEGWLLHKIAERIKTTTPTAWDEMSSV
jgi:hypothetical protein